MKIHFLRLNNATNLCYMKQNSALYCHHVVYGYPTTAGLCLVKSTLIGHNVFYLSH